MEIVTFVAAVNPPYDGVHHGAAGPTLTLQHTTAFGVFIYTTLQHPPAKP